MQNDSDTLAVTHNQDTGLFTLHRKSKEPFVDSAVFNMEKHEMFVLLENLLDIPEIGDRAIAVLQAKGLVRPNHG